VEPAVKNEYVGASVIVGLVGRSRIATHADVPIGGPVTHWPVEAWSTWEPA